MTAVALPKNLKSSIERHLKSDMGHLFGGFAINDMDDEKVELEFTDIDFHECPINIRELIESLSKMDKYFEKVEEACFYDMQLLVSVGAEDCTPCIQITCTRERKLVNRY